MSTTNPNQPKVEASESVLPAPEEIAKIAAALSGRYGSSETAVKEAIVLYLHAYIAYRELAPLEIEKIILRFNDQELTQWLLRTSTRSVKRRLYPDGARVAAPIRSEFFEGDLDPARKYLTERAAYLNWKTTRQVRYSIRLLFVDEAERHNEHFSEAIVELERKHQEMAANRGITMEQLRNGMGIPSDQLRRNGLQEFLDFMRRSEVRENDHEGKRLYWELEESFLDKLIAWRRDVKKRPGGIKQLEKKYAKVTSPIQSHEE